MNPTGFFLFQAVNVTIHTSDEEATKSTGFELILSKYLMSTTMTTSNHPYLLFMQIHIRLKPMTRNKPMAVKRKTNQV